MKLPLKIVESDMPKYSNVGRGIRITDASHRVVCTVLPGEGEDAGEIAKTIVRRVNGLRWNLFSGDYFGREAWEFESSDNDWYNRAADRLGQDG